MIIALLFAGLFLLLQGEEQKPPQITTGEFPFVVEYEMNPKDIELNMTGTAATFRIKFEKLPIAQSARANPKLSLKKIREELVDISQALSMQIPLSEGQVVVPSSKPPVGSKNAQAASQQLSPVYKYLAFSFSSSMDPPEWEFFFQPFGGLEVTKIEYNPNSGSALTNNWKYEGRIYESEKDKKN